MLALKQGPRSFLQIPGWISAPGKTGRLLWCIPPEGDSSVSREMGLAGHGSLLGDGVASYFRG